MIATALPVEGRSSGRARTLQVTVGPAFGSPGHVVYRPADLSSFPAKDTLPGDGLGQWRMRDQQHPLCRFPDDDRLARLRRLATAAEPGGSWRRATADNLRKAIEWAETENKRDGSPLERQDRARSLAVMGQSCGGFLSTRAGSGSARGHDRRVQLGVQGNNVAQLTALHGPVLLINGHERDFLMASSKATYDAIEKLPAFYGARHGAGHTATVDHPGGGEWANVASNWLRWQLKGDKQGRQDVRRQGLQPLHELQLDTASKRLGVRALYRVSLTACRIVSITNSGCS